MLILVLPKFRSKDFFPRTTRRSAPNLLIQISRHAMSLPVSILQVTLRICPLSIAKATSFHSFKGNYAAFGSGITVRGMGFALQNRGALFSLDPSHPNALAPRKRPFHTIIPAFMERGSQHIGFGIMGGPNQPLAHAQFVSNVVDYGMNIQAALEAARFTVSSRRGCNILIESRVRSETLQQLSRMGHQLEIRREYSTAMGRGQAVLHDSQSQINYGASDARADGSAEPEPPPLK
jgi:gamma-glutamyltranspeptidase/glutathione hydrolase